MRVGGDFGVDYGSFIVWVEEQPEDTSQVCFHLQHVFLHAE